MSYAVRILFCYALITIVSLEEFQPSEPTSDMTTTSTDSDTTTDDYGPGVSS